MHSIKWIRDNAIAFDEGLIKRGGTPLAAELLHEEKTLRMKQTEAQSLSAKRNAMAKEIGQKKAKGESVEKLLAVVATTKVEEEQKARETLEANKKLEEKLAAIPNIPLQSVPVGHSEADNKEISRHGNIRVFEFTPKEHWMLGEELGLMDFTTAATIAGSRFVILKGALATLERAIEQLMMDTHREKFGYTEIRVPLLVNKETAYGTGNLPKFEDDLFKTTDDRYLIPTAELPLTNMVAGKILKEDDLPLRFVSAAPCFRAEAGAAGRDTRGMIRQHQFMKVEMVSITKASQEQEEHHRMTTAAQNILEQLELPYKLMHLCTGDMGFSAQSTYDIEVWLPSVQAYREISSCSQCGAFQARRMDARYRDNEGVLHHVHTLNGSGLAVGRTLVAILENYQNADGSITIPKALQPYMRGITKIAKEKVDSIP